MCVRCVCVVVCRSVVQCGAVVCRVWISVLRVFVQCVAVFCGVLQCVAVWCSGLQSMDQFMDNKCCSVVQRDAVWYIEGVTTRTRRRHVCESNRISSLL